MAVVDTTGRAIVRAAEGSKISEDSLNEALGRAATSLKLRDDAIKVRKIQRRKLENAAAVVNVRLDGFG
jgi:hypothetical protein